MLLHLIIALILGIIAGTFTGLIPGIHINLITTALISTSLIHLPQNPLIVFIIALSVTHTFLDFIPSVFLGAANEDTINSILPGHRFLLEGKGPYAIKLTLIGSMIAVLSLIIIIPIIYLVILTSYDFINKMMGFILISTIFFLLYSEQKSKKLAIIIFFLAGVLGTITLNSNVEQPLLPLLTGLFGASTIINSISTKTRIPKQKIEKIKINKKQLIKPALLTMLISPLCSFLPGLGASQAATISTRISKQNNNEQFLILLGSINTLILTVSFFTLYLTNKTRSGAASAIYQITILTPKTLLLIIITIITSAVCSYFLASVLTKFFARYINQINYKKISVIILIIITFSVFLITGIHGILVYITATLLGLFTIKTNTTRSHLMGAILLPTTIYYLPI